MIHRLAVPVALTLVLAFASPGRSAEPDPIAVAFGTIQSVWGPSLSPDGSKVVFLRMHPDDLPIAVVFDLTTKKSQVVMASSKDEFDLRWCAWANDERLLCGLRAIETDGHMLYPVSRLVAVNSDASRMKVLLQRKLRDEWTQHQDRIVDWLVEDPKQVLVRVPDRLGSGVSRLDIYSGKLRRVERVREGVWEWVSDGRGTPRLRRHRVRDEHRWSYRNPGEKEWHELHSSDVTDLEESFQPIGCGSDPNKILFFDQHEGRLALFAETLLPERKTELVFSHPEVDVAGTSSLGKHGRLVAVGYATDRYHQHFFDSSVEKVVADLEKHLPGSSVSILDESWDRTRYLAWAGSAVDPGHFYLYSPGTQEILRLAARNPKLAGRKLASMEPYRYAARDGVEIPAYLTLPASASEGPVPTVLLPHGGPQARDHLGFDWLVQFFAAHGYAVLQSNYRGSSGYGMEWIGQGAFRSWRMAIGDVLDGADRLVEEGVADPDRICMVGWSYGGYAALMSAIEAPEKFRCVVSIAGVVDPEMLIADGRDFQHREAQKEFIGTDPEVLVQGSPLKRVKELEAPLLLFHPDEDINVAVDHSRKLARAAKSSGKDVEYIEYPEVEHQIFRNGYRIDMLDRIGVFLKEQLAPRPASSAASAASAVAEPAAAN